MAEKLGDVIVRFGADIEDIKKALNNMNKETSKSGKQMEDVFSTVGGVIAGAFAVEKVAAFLNESVKLAAEAEGIKSAFDNIAGANIDKLTKSVQGTVSEVELMRAAVNANNMKVPIKELAGYFEFATKRAAQTGASVDYLVNSMVMGVGRGSLEVWDNLGFSISEVRAKLGGVSMETLTVGERAKLMSEMAQNALKGMGDVALTTAQKMQQNAAELDNLKVDIGNKMIPAFTAWYEIIGKVLTSLQDIFMTAEEQGANASSSFFASMIEQGLDGEDLFDRYTLRLKALQAQITKFKASRNGMFAQEDEYKLLISQYETLTKEFAKYQMGLHTAAKAQEAEATSVKEVNKELERQAILLADINKYTTSKNVLGQDVKTQDKGIPQIGGTTGAALGINPAMYDGTYADGIRQAAEATAYLNEQVAIDAFILEQASNFARDLGFNFAEALVNGESMGEALSDVFKNLIIQLIGMVAQAAILAAIMSVISGGTGMAFGALFKQNLLGGAGGGGMQLGGMVQGQNIYLSNARGAHQLSK